ncbi:MAG: ABC transporter permease [Bacteroides sp.]
MKSFLKFLSRNKLYTLIEAFGLSVALGFVILLLCYARSEFSVGKHDATHPHTYAVGHGDFVGTTLGVSKTFFPDIPEIEQWTRLLDIERQTDILVGEGYYSIPSVAVDTNFFQLFSYPLEGCDRRKVLVAADEVLLSRSFAHKAFGAESPLGKPLRYKDDDYRVAGLFDDLPSTSIFNPIDLMFSIQAFEADYPPMDMWGATQAFVVLSPQADPKMVEEKLLNSYVKTIDGYSRENDNNFIWGSTLTSLEELHFSTLSKYDPYRTEGSRKQVQILLLVALVLLISAIFNYINLNVALTGNRAKEMTTRRVLGESNRGILCRYIGESLLFTSVCFALGAFIAWVVRPLFEKWLSTTILFTVDGWSLTVILGLLLLIAIVSALLPTLFILRFKPIDVVKGTFRFKNKMLFGRLFIVAQNVLSCGLLAIGLTMWLQVHHLATLPCGYRTDGLIAVYAYRLLGGNNDARIQLQKRLEQLPCVKSVGRTMQIPPFTGHNGCHEPDGTQSWLRFSQLDSTSFRQLGFHIVEQYEEDVYGKIWIDSETQRRYGVSTDKRWIGGTESDPGYRVCGIVNDYRSRDALYTPIDDSHNAIFMLGPDRRFFNLLVEVQGDDRQGALQEVKRVCRETTQEYLGMPIELASYYIDDRLNDMLSGTRNTMTLMLSFMLIALLISALGLLAMSIYYTQQRCKEIAIRKVMGAASGSAVWQLSRNFLWLTVAAVVIATPLSIKAMDYYLQEFYYRIDFPWWVLLVAAMASLLISLLSVIGQSYRVATMNPYDNIRTE